MGSIVSVTYVNFPLENNTSQMVGLFFEFYFFVMMNIHQGEKGNSNIHFCKKMNIHQGERGGVYTFFYPKKTVFRKFHVRKIEQLTIQNS